MGWTVYYYLQRDEPLSDAEYSSLVGHYTRWSKKDWEWESYQLHTTRLRRQDGLLAYGMTKPHPDVDEHPDDLDQLLAAVTELGSLIDGSTLYVSDDYGTLFWDPQKRSITDDSNRASAMPQFELGRGWKEMPDSGEDDEDDDFDSDDEQGSYFDDDEEDDDEGSYFDDDEEDDERVERLSVAWPAEQNDTPVFSLDPESLRLERVFAGGDHKLRFTARVRTRGEGRLKINRIWGLIRDADGIAIGFDDAWLDRTVGDSAEIHGELDYGVDGLNDAATLELRLEGEYKFKKLDLGTLALEPSFRPGENKYRERQTFESQPRAGCPFAAPTIAVFRGYSWGDNNLDVIVELRTQPQFTLTSADLALVALSREGKRLHRETGFVSDTPSIERFTMSSDDCRFSEMGSLTLTAKGEAEFAFVLGPVAITQVQ